MLEHVTTLFCCGHQKFQPFADLPLPGELAEHWRSQRDFEGGIGFWRFHGRVCGNLITSNQKLRTTRFVLWQSSLGSAGCQPAIVGSLPTRFCSRVAQASRVLVSTSRRNNLFREVGDDETSSPTRETRALPERSSTANLLFGVAIDERSRRIPVSYRTAFASG